eukprot:329976_1
MAEQLKLEGNKLFQQHKYAQSVAKYSKAINLDASNAIFYANRSAAFIALKKFKNAEMDAKRSIELDPKYLKGYIRLAFAYQNQCKFQAASNQYNFILSSNNFNIKQNQINLIKQRLVICENNLKPKDVFDEILTTQTKRKLFPSFKLNNKMRQIIGNKSIENVFDLAIAFEFELKKFDVASQLYRYLCNKNDVQSICNYALWYLDGNRPGIKKHLNKAYQMFEYATFLDRNQGFTLYNMSQFYYDGNIVNQDYKIAFKLCKKAIQDKQMKTDLKHHQSYALISHMYALGRGTNVNVKLSG